MQISYAVMYFLVEGRCFSGGYIELKDYHGPDGLDHKVASDSINGYEEGFGCGFPNFPSVSRDLSSFKKIRPLRSPHFVP